MALDETRPDRASQPRLRSREGRRSARPSSAPAPALSAPAPEAGTTPRGLFAWLGGPYGKLVAKAAGICALMLGLAGVGALAMAQGLEPRKVLLDSRGEARAPAAAQLTPALGPTSAARSLPTPTPSASAAPPAVAAESEVTQTATSNGLTADGRVILNQASVEDLRKLPGIGAKRAEAIVALRERLGKFKRVSDLMRVKGIGPKRLKQLAPKLVLDP